MPLSEICVLIRAVVLPEGVFCCKATGNHCSKHYVIMHLAFSMVLL